MKKGFLRMAIIAIAVFSIIMVVSCNKGSTPEPAGEEGGTYYCVTDENSLITLSDGNKFTFDVAGQSRKGSYELAGTTLTLTFKEKDQISATLNGYNEMTFEYDGTQYRFLKKKDYTVNFSTDGGSAVESATVMNGKTVARPTINPTKREGDIDYLFAGWYGDQACTRRYDFDTPVTDNITLYAKFIKPINNPPEFNISFAGEGIDISDVETIGGMAPIDNIVQPTKAGDKFIGWWVGVRNNKDKLSYRYNYEVLHENTVLYAVWESDLAGKPEVSVKDGKITWKGTGATLEIKTPSGITLNPSVTGESYDIPADTLAREGEYEITVTVAGKATTVYYLYKGLATVSVFKVDGNIVQFFRVPDATDYKLTIQAKDGEHKDIVPEQDAQKNVCYYDFGSLDIPEDGYKFKVTATANGFVSSESEEFVHNRILGEVKNINVNDMEEVSWETVENATDYEVSIVSGGKTVTETTQAANYSLKYFNRGQIEIKVKAKAYGWNSADYAVKDYTKARLGAVKNETLVMAGETLSWESVEGATEYEVTINGTIKQTVTDPNIELKEEYLGADKKVTLEIVAKDSQDANSTSLSTVTEITQGKMGTVEYRGGKLTWAPVFGASEFEIKVNDGESQFVTGLEAEITLTAKQNVIKIRVKDSSEDDWATKDVTAYEIKLSKGYNDEYYDSIYKAAGDPIDLSEVETTRYGYEFKEWHDDQNRKFESTQFTFNSDITLTATWTAHQFKITFQLKKDETDSVLSEQIISYGQSDYQLEVAVSNRNEYTFYGWAYNLGAAGWQRQTDHTGKALSPFLYAYEEGEEITEVVFTAQWAEIFIFKKENGKDEYSVAKSMNIDLVSEVTIPAEHAGAEGTFPVTAVSDFSGCRNLTKIRIPATVTSINLGSTAASFSGSRILDVEVYEVDTVDKADQRFTSKVNGVETGVLFANDEEGNPTRLIYYPFGRMYIDASYTIPYGISTISTGAFYSTDTNIGAGNIIFETINIPSSVSLLEIDSFYGIRSLKTINFMPEEEGKPGATSLDIRPNAFNGTSAYYSSAYNVTTFNLPKRLSSIDVDVLNKFRSLQSFHVEDGGTFISFENDDTFRGVLGKKIDKGNEVVFFPRGREIPNGQITFPNDVYSIGEFAFADNSNVKDVTISAQITNIGKGAFSGCDMLEKLTFLGSTEDDDLTIGEYAFAGYYIKADTGILMGYNQEMTELTLPENLTTLGKGAFGAIQNLKTVTIKTNRSSVNFATGAFACKDYFANSESVVEVHLYNTVPSFTVPEVFGSKLQRVFIEGGESEYFVSGEDGVLYNKEMTELLFFPTTYDGQYVLPETITKIPANMFVNRTGLQSIKIHKGVTEIGERAFSGCKNLTSVEFENGGTELAISTRAFQDCVSLTDLALPTHLKSLGESVFASCSNLRNVELPASLEKMALASYSMYGNGQEFTVFDGCSKIVLTVNEKNPYFKVIDGVLYTLREVTEGETDEITEIDGKKYVCDTLLKAINPTKAEIVIPSSVRMVSSCAFERLTGLTKVTFTDTVKLTKNVVPEGSETAKEDDGKVVLQGGAFQYNEGLAEIRLPAGLEIMDDSSLVYNSSLTKLFIPNTVTSIKSSAIRNNSKINSIEFQEGGTEGLRIEDGTESRSEHGATVHQGVFGMSGLTSITFPARLVYLGKYSFTTSSVDSEVSYIQQVVFTADETNQFTLELAENALYRTTKLTSITLAEGITAIPKQAFYYSGLDTVEIPASVTSIGEQAFYQASLRTVVIKENSQLASIGKNAFAYCKSLVSFTFGKNAAAEELSIGDSAFSEAKLLATFEVPANATTLGKEVFKNDSALASITFALDEQQKSKLTSIGDSAFTGTAIKEIRFPETYGDLKFGDAMFSNCKSLTDIYISSTVSVLGNLIKGAGSIKKIDVAEKNPHFRADKEKPIIYDEKGSIMLIYADVNGVFTIAPGATTIGAGSFTNAANITEVILPATVQTIGANAFENCISLTTLTIPSGSQLKEIGAFAFKNCVSLEVVDFSNAEFLTKFGDGTSTDGGIFAGCTKLRKVVLGSGVTTLGTYMFSKSSVQEVDMSRATSLKEFPKVGSASHVFYQCDKLTTVTFPKVSQITYLGYYTFSGCTSLQEIDLSGLTQLTQISSSSTDTTPKSVNLFDGCTSLRSVKLPTSIKMIGGYTFQNCAALTSMASIENIDKVTSFGDYVFKGTSIAAFEMKDGVTYGASLFSDDIALTSVTLPAGGLSLTTVPNKMFAGCTSLASFDFTKLPNITKIGDNAFQNTALTVADFSNCKSLAELGANVFQNSKITALDFTNTVITKFGDNAFNGCALLTSVQFPKTLTVLGKNTFQGTGLQSIDLSVCTELKAIYNSATITNSIVSSTKVYTFADCAKLTSVTLPEVENGFLVGPYAFQNCVLLDSIDFTKISVFGEGCFENTGFTEITLPVAKTGSWSGSYNNTSKYALGGKNWINCQKLTTVNIPATFKWSAGGSTLFGTCPKLQNVKFADGYSGSLPTYMFQGSGVTSIDLSKTSLTTLPANMFDGCESLVSANLNNGKITALGNYMFRGCSSLNSVTLPNTLTNPGTYTFQNCTSLVQIDFSETKITRFSSSATANVTSSTSSYIFSGCTRLQTVKVPEGFVQIAGFAFENCVSLKNFDLSNITHIGKQAFQYSGIEEVKLNKLTNIFNYTTSGITYTPFDGCMITTLEVGEGVSAYKIVEEGLSKKLVDSAEANVFAVAFNGTVIDEGKTLDLSKTGATKLSAYQFSKITGYDKIILPETLLEIPAYAFDGSTIKEVVLPQGLTTIGFKAFQNSKLTSITIPSSVTKIGQYAFMASDVATVKVESSNFVVVNSSGAEQTGWYLFQNCLSLTEATFADGLTTIDGYTFDGCSLLSSIKLPQGLTKLGQYALRNCVALTKVDLPESINEIGLECLLGTSITAIDLHNVTIIGARAFQKTQLQSIVIPASVVNMGGNLFQDLTTLKSATVNAPYMGNTTAANPSLSSGIFQNCTNLNQVTLSNEIADIPTNTFSGCTALATIQLPSGLLTMGANAFKGSGLTKIDIPEGFTTFNNNTFDSCTSLSYIVVPSTLTQMQVGTATSSVFYGWTKNQKVYMHHSKYSAVSLFGINWLIGTEAEIIYDYVPGQTPLPTSITAQTSERSAGEQLPVAYIDRIAPDVSVARKENYLAK